MSDKPSAISSPRQRFYCSFCGKEQDEVAKLIAGPTVFICDECVDLCQHIISRQPLTTPTKISLMQQQRDADAVKALAEMSMPYRSDEDLTAELRALADVAPVLSPGYVLLSRRDWDRLVLSTLGLPKRRE
jgi:hypothetical protein